jgi:RimJ/RimL family protein N-acetyltransferase
VNEALVNHGMWHQQIIAGFSVELRPLQPEQLEMLRQWRNDPIIAAPMLQQQYISETMQQQWFSKVRADQRQAQFVIFYKNEAIGACNLKSANGDFLASAETIETGFYLAHPRFRGTLFAFFPALALNQYCFESLNCKTLLAHVKLSNSAALRFNEKLGYQRQSDNITVQAGAVDQGVETIELAVFKLNAQQHEQAAAAFAPFIRN